MQSIHGAEGVWFPFRIGILGQCCRKSISKRFVCAQKRLEEQEETLTFSKHQKVLKMIKYSRFYEDLCIRLS